jgi:hypothetical protein
MSTFLVGRRAILVFAVGLVAFVLGHSALGGVGCAEQGNCPAGCLGSQPPASMCCCCWDAGHTRLDCYWVGVFNCSSQQWCH